MAAPKRRAAMRILWKSPQEQYCSMIPEGDRGILEIDIIGEQVVIHGRNCVYKVRTKGSQEVDEKALSEVEISVPMNVCQINWHVVARKPGEEVERSVYFKNT